MADFLADDNKPIEILGSIQPVEASDKLPLRESSGKNAVAEALQDEVIRLRQESRKFAKKGAVDPPDSSDSISGQVQGSQPLLAALNPSTSLSKPDSSANLPTESELPSPNKPSESVSADQDLLSVFQAPSKTVSLAYQDNLIAPTGQQTELKMKPLTAIIAPVDTGNHKETSNNEIAETSSNTFAPRKRDIALLAPQEHSPTMVSHLSNVLSSTDSVQIAATPTEQHFTQSSADTTQKSFSSVESKPTNQFIAGDAKQTIAFQNAFANQLDTSASQSYKERPVIASQNIPAVASQQLQQTEQATKVNPTNSTGNEKAVAFNAAQPTTTNSSERSTARNVSEGQIASASPADKNISTNSESQTRSQRDQIAFNPAADSSALKSQDLAKSSAAQDVAASVPRQPVFGQTPSDRAGTIASANTADYPLSAREPVKELSKESKDKDVQLSNAINYPKFGGATPVEESSKPVIQQQKTSSSQPSLARDSASEKGQSLSEALVSGKILSQSTKESQADSKSADNKASAAKVADGKSTDVKADAKSSDLKTADSRLPEGRSADPRSLDSSHLSTFPTAKTGAEAHGLHPTAMQQGQPADKVILAAANPATTGKIDNQPTGKASDGTTKSDAAQAETSATDKGGKKPDGVDDKKETSATAKGPGNTTDTGKHPGGKSFNDLLDFIDKADQGGDIKPGGKSNIPLGGSNILSPDDVLITGTGAIAQAGFPGAVDDDGKDEATNDDKLSHRRKKYIVQAGDTLDSIAKAELGDERFSALILTINQAQIASRKENDKSVAIRLQPGQILWLPSDHEVQVHAELYLFD